MINAILIAIFAYLATYAAVYALRGLTAAMAAKIRSAFTSPDAPPPSWRTRLVFVLVGAVLLLASPLLLVLLTAAAAAASS
jgi:hypothetical protein